MATPYINTGEGAAVSRPQDMTGPDSSRRTAYEPTVEEDRRGGLVTRLEESDGQAKGGGKKEEEAR